MRIGRIIASAALATAAVAATALPATAGGKAFHGPEFITAQKLTAPTTVEFAYRCKPGAADRSIEVALTAPETYPTTDFSTWLKGKQVVCNNKTQHVKAVLTESREGKDRLLKPGETGRVWLRIYGGGRDVLQTRLMTAH
ncbi:hypothetical protein [Streptomyces melanogenes]|uniref:hypothetical protein n=1 Tax=Streptomyces melanogenes TaxID=67326 RepID=UPI00167D32E9|nr:hypothetical protein [Streptomyces melanogenes]GGP77019.1 hypothetical protein GCM10010278_64240 [Streptomyces melanogenes]